MHSVLGGGEGCGLVRRKKGNDKHIDMEDAHHHVVVGRNKLSI